MIFFVASLLLLPLSRVAVAETGGQTISGRDLRVFFEHKVTAHCPWPAEDLAVRRFRARPEEIRVPKGRVGYRLTGPSPTRHPGRKTLDVIVTVDGEEVDRMHLSGELHLFGDAVCTVQKVRRGQVLAKEDVKMVKSDLTWLPQGVVADPAQVVGMKLRSSLRPGSVILERHLEAPPLVERGDAVTIVAGGAFLRVSAPGQVKDDGAAGEVVRVKNMMSRKILLATVRDDTTVVVEY